MKKDPQFFLAHILDAINLIQEYTENGESSFFQDRKTQDAVIRNLEIIGEAVKKLPEDMLSRHPEVPWKDVAGMRDQLIHHYFGVNLRLVWGVVANRLTELREAVLSEYTQLI